MLTLGYPFVVYQYIPFLSAIEICVVNVAMLVRLMGQRVK